MVTKINYSISEIQDEARCLLEKGAIDLHQPICILCEFISPREWICLECELEKNDYTLRDRICDLLCHEEWQED